MDEEKYQKELFEFEKPKRLFPKLSDFFPKGDFERNVILTLTLDRAVFIAIGIIMVMVALYALGVEAGKSRATESARMSPALPVVAPQAVRVVAPQAAKVIAPQPVVTTQARMVKQNQPVKITAPVAKTQVVTKVPAKPVPAPVVSNVAKPYTIVVATFVSKDTAMREIDKLKKQGYNITLIQSDRYFQVCIGAYTDRAGTDSQKDLKKIKRLYKDAYIRAR